MPCNIVFYRDGVSEGEYDKIKAEEGGAVDGTRGSSMRASRLLSVSVLSPAAYADCLANKSLKFDVKPLAKPRIIFLVVGKRRVHHFHIVSYAGRHANSLIANRHHIRFFPSQRTPAP